MATNGASRPLIFISHSARDDPEAYKNLGIIRDRLKNDRFEVLIDETSIEGGDPWNEHINTWIAYCHGAIILLTQKALKSAWVQKEAAILSWRRSRSRSDEFKLLPVLFGASAEDVKSSAKFGVLELADYQALMKLRELPLAEKLATLLEPLRGAQITTPRQLAENKLANLLQGVSAPLLQDVINRLGEDAGGWKPDKSLANSTAMFLLQASLKRIADANALQPLTGVLPATALKTIVAMVRASWIDVLIAARFMEVAAMPEGMRAAALNGTEPQFTERSLFSRANGGASDWKYIEISDRSGEDQGGSFIGQIDAWCKRNRLGKDREAFLRVIKINVQTAPFLIVLPPLGEQIPPPDEDELDRLLQTYSPCTFFVLTGLTALAPERLRRFVRLDPQLEHAAESMARDYFAALRVQVGVTEEADEL